MVCPLDKHFSYHFPIQIWFSSLSTHLVTHFLLQADLYSSLLCVQLIRICFFARTIRRFIVTCRSFLWFLSKFCCCSFFSCVKWSVFMKNFSLTFHSLLPVQLKTGISSVDGCIDTYQDVRC